MHTVRDLPTLSRSLPRVLFGVACTLLVLDRTRRRGKNEACDTTCKGSDTGASLAVEEDSVDGVVHIKDPTPVAAVPSAVSLEPRGRDALAVVTKLITSVRVSTVFKSMWLVLAVPIALVKAWAGSLPKLHMVGLAYHCCC